VFGKRKRRVSIGREASIHSSQQKGGADPHSWSPRRNEEKESLLLNFSTTDGVGGEKGDVEGRAIKKKWTTQRGKDKPRQLPAITHRLNVQRGEKVLTNRLQLTFRKGGKGGANSEKKGKAFTVILIFRSREKDQ